MRTACMFCVVCDCLLSWLLAAGCWGSAQPPSSSLPAPSTMVLKVPKSACKIVLSTNTRSGEKVMFPAYMCANCAIPKLNVFSMTPKRVELDMFLTRGFFVEGTLTHVTRGCKTKKDAYDLFMKTHRHYALICLDFPDLADPYGNYEAVWEMMIETLPLEGFSVREDMDPNAPAPSTSADAGHTAGTNEVEVEITGVTSLEERNKIGFASAINLD